MATTQQLCHQVLRPRAAVNVTSRRQSAVKISDQNTPFNTTSHSKTVHINNYSKWAVRLSLVEQSAPKPATVDVDRLVDFLYDDLPHLFDDQGIDRTAYDEQVKFRDPITKHDSISGYLFNISLLKNIFSPDFFLHWVKQTGPYEITTRWTMVMTFMLLPWKPELVFTGTSVMAINPDTGKFCSHLDLWDSIENNDYFSLEGLLDVFKQLRYYKTPDLGTPKYLILKRTANYEVRKYEPFIVVEGRGDKLSGSAGFNDVTGYIFGKNSKEEKIAMTTPVFTEARNSNPSNVSIQVVLPLDKDMKSLPDPEKDTISLRRVEGGTAAVLKFSGKPTEEVVLQKEKLLRSTLVKDGLKPRNGSLLARYNDPGRTKSFVMVRNYIAEEGSDLEEYNYINYQEKSKNSRTIKGRNIAAAMKFLGEPTQDIVLKNEKILRSSLIADGLSPKAGFSLACNADNPGKFIWSLPNMSNEVLIWLEKFTMDYHYMLKLSNNL